MEDMDSGSESNYSGSESNDIGSESTKKDQNPTTMDQDAMHGYDSQMMMVMHTVPKRVPTIGLWVWWFCLLLTNQSSTVWGPTCYGVLDLV